MNANDRQVGGSHYGHGKLKMQHWDLVATLNMGYFPGCATKYAERWDKKNGSADVEKAIHYLQKYKEVMEGSYMSAKLPFTYIQDTLGAYFAERATATPEVVEVFGRLCHGHDVEDVTFAMDQLSVLLEKARATEATKAYTNQDGSPK